MTAQSKVTWASLAALLSVVATVVGGTQYVDRSIATAERRAVAKAEAEIAKRQIQVADVYARRDDVREIKARLDQVIELQRAILVRLDEK